MAPISWGTSGREGTILMGRGRVWGARMLTPRAQRLRVTFSRTLRVAAASSAIGLVALLLAAPASAYRYLPDPHFGSAGFVNLLEGNGTGGSFREVRDVEPGPEASTYVFSALIPDPKTYACEETYLISRYLKRRDPRHLLRERRLRPAHPTAAVHVANLLR